MDWQSQLITVYVTVCDLWSKGICETARRFSNNKKFDLTDEEVVTLYLFGIMSSRFSILDIYRYADRHLRDWFPSLAGYDAFCYRLNRLSGSFISLVEKLVQSRESGQNISVREWVVDSFPIVLAGPRRSGTARVAEEFCDKGFCSSKDLYFYGVKLHCVATLQSGTIPFPSMLGLAPASANDHRLFEQASGEFFNGRMFGDKAYGVDDHKKQLEQQNVQLLTPIKKVKGIYSLPGPDAYSTWVSAMRQPIESLFNWINEKTGLQKASKVRSAAGLIVHVFGKLAAAVLMMVIR
jgi:hypothetical protein